MIRNAENPRNSFITTTQLAKICQADPKSVRTWVERKQGPPHLLTPGRHLRFRVGDVAEWLAKRGYEVPQAYQQFIGKGAK